MDQDKRHIGEAAQRIRADETEEERARREAAEEGLHAPSVDDAVDPLTGEPVPPGGRDLGGSDDPDEGLKQAKGEKAPPMPPAARRKAKADE